MHNWLASIEKQWYHKPTWVKCFTPVEYLFTTVALARKILYKKYAYTSTIPVWIVGNISVGGNGKTPFVAELATRIQEQGYQVMVISHGYRSQCKHRVTICAPDSDPVRYGDEAVLLANLLQKSVVVAKKRAAAVRYIEKHYPETRVILCDDGLQHYQLGRDKEVVLIDKSRLGNQRCLPVGPLREPMSRLEQADLCLYRHAGAHSDIRYDISHFHHLSSQQVIAKDKFPFTRVHAVAGIANPEHFFQSLEALGVEVIRHRFPDHHRFKPEDCAFSDNIPVLMTTKDAVKCEAFTGENCYAVIMRLSLSAHAHTQINALIASLGTC